MGANYTEYTTGKFSLNVSPIGSSGDVLLQDTISTAFVNIDLVHYRIHTGRHFNVTDVSTGINIATPKRYLFITPNTTTRIHIIYRVETVPGSKIELYEGTTTSANGTAIARINSNRTSANTAETTAFEDPTVTANGTLLFEDQSGSTIAGGKLPAEVQHDDETILKQNTKYQIIVTPLANGTDVSLHVDWYEVV